MINPSACFSGLLLLEEVPEGGLRVVAVVAVVAVAVCHVGRYDVCILKKKKNFETWNAMRSRSYEDKNMRLMVFLYTTIGGEESRSGNSAFA